MKKYYLLFVALVLLVLDIRIPTFAYPVFEEFRTEAPKTVDMVINHVLGHKVPLDIISDAIGYILLAAASLMIGIKNKKFRKVFVWTAIALGTNFYRYYMPFLLNGDERFRVGYIIYFVAAACEAIVTFYAMYALCGQLETLENHSYNNVTVIIAMICIATGMVAAIMNFFDLMILSVVYYLVQIVLMGVYWYMVNRDKHLLMKWEEKHA